MKISLPKGKYIGKIEINDTEIEIDFKKKKKIGLLLIGLNERYWPYLEQVIKDAKQNFLPHHKVDFLVWSDMPQGKMPEVTVFETAPVEWPAPTLMRYHLFLQQEEKLNEYDYLFYLDADMRIVEKISDDVIGEGLTTAPHPGYVLNSRFIPPLEPNKESSAFIERLGEVRLDERGLKRFIPFYAAGGFQGGKTDIFIKAMKAMRETIDEDFNRNYVAIWNDESHWNKYLWDFQKKGGAITFLDVSYIYPDSLIKEYYIPMWGRDYPPKIITLTKPFSLSKQAGSELNAMMGGQINQKYRCPQCGDTFETPGHVPKRVVECPGTGKPHQVEMEKI